MFFQKSTKMSGKNYCNNCKKMKQYRHFQKTLVVLTSRADYRTRIGREVISIQNGGGSNGNDVIDKACAQCAKT